MFWTLAAFGELEIESDGPSYRLINIAARLRY
jgi:hypothetical protein